MKIQGKLFLLSGFICISNLVSAQVNIGSDAPPRDGAILDLGTELIRKKGLGMPRVALESVDKLSIAADGKATEHMGVILFNTTQRETKDNRICKGLHVWSGTKWVPLKPYPAHPTLPKKPDPIVFSDNDGNSYQAKWIGTRENLDEFSCSPVIRPMVVKGGYWMSENLRTTTDHQGKSLNQYTGIRINPAVQTGAIPTHQVQVMDKIGLYPRTVTYSVGSASATKTYDQFADQFGLLYTFQEATRACPIGWRLPSKEDMNELAANLNTEQVGSSYMGLGTKLKGENLFYTPAPSFGTGMLWNPTYTENTDSDFNAVPTGYFAPMSSPVDFAKNTFWWSSEAVQDKAVRYGAHSDHENISIINVDQRHNLPVRCVPDLTDKTKYDSSTQMLTDREGNEYYTANFGAAGRWMTQNLRVKTTPGGLPIEKKAVHDDAYPNIRRYEFPKGPASDYKEFHGLIYDFNTLTDGVKVDLQIEEGEGIRTHRVINPDPRAVEQIGVQGICPNGWHVPSDKEWNDLEAEIGSDITGKYTDGYIPSPAGRWDESLRCGIGYRPSGAPSLGGYGSSFQSQSGPNSGFLGHSKPYNEGGFDAVAIGGIAPDGTNIRYSELAYFWTSSVSQNYAWYRHPTTEAVGNSGFFRSSNVRGSMMPVRCKQDAEDLTSFDPMHEILVDREGNNYSTAVFGSSGRWTTQNLRVTTTPSGEQLLYKAVAGAATEKRIHHPYGNLANDVLEHYKPEHGLLYSHVAATDGAKVGSTVNDTESTYPQLVSPNPPNPNPNDVEKVGVQGVCPDGWHVPSDKEVNDLEKALLDDRGGRFADNYVPTVLWQEKYRYDFGYRPVAGPGVTGHGAVMKSKKSPTHPVNPALFFPGYSKDGKDGGFDLYATGYIESDGVAGAYNAHAYLWTSSVSGDGRAIYRNTAQQGDQKSVIKTHRSYDLMMPVRCRRDDIDHTYYNPIKKILFDREGNSYNVGEFGNAGTWMTQNLRVKSLPSGQKLVLKDIYDATTPVMRYHFVNKVDNLDQYPEYGLLYDFETVTAGLKHAVTVNQGEGTPGVNTANATPANIEKVGVQGICPTGWHVPSDREWNDLEAEIGSNTTTKYTDSFIPVPTGLWNESNRIKVHYRPDNIVNAYGMSFRSKQAPVGQADFVPGKSKHSSQGGFDMIGTGSITPVGLNGHSPATYPYAWTSSTGDLNIAWYRHPNVQANTADGIFRSAASRGYMMPVRCKKDEIR